MPVGRRVPLVIINPVQDAADLVAMHVQGVAQAIILRGIHDLPRVTRGDRRYKIGIHHTAFHHVDSGTVEIVLEPIRMKDMPVRVEAGSAQDALAANALVLEIMESVTDPRMGHAKPLKNFIKQHRHQSGLPVVAMDDVRVFVAFEHELESGTGKKSKALVIVSVTVENPPIEEVLIGMRLDEEAFAAMNEAEINAAMNGVIEPGDPKIFVRKPQIKALVVP